MPLTGLSPNDPLPGDYREFAIGAGDSPLGSPDRLHLLIGNRTTLGTETVDTIDMTRPVQSEADCITRAGRRSELLWEYRKAVAVDPGATYYLGPVTESVGTAASCTFTFAGGAATGTTTLEICFLGEKAYASVSKDDTAIVIAAAAMAAINQASEGSWMATAAVGGGGSEHILTVTMSLKGPRFGLALGSSSTVGMRMRFLDSIGTTVTKGGFSAGTTEDDGTAIIAAAALGEFFYISSPWHSTSAWTATDNQNGELLEMVKAQNLPINGKEMTVTTGFVGTQAQSTTVATSSPGNTVQGHIIWQENSDWLPGMLAAHWSAVRRTHQIAYASKNLNGYRSADGQVFQIPTAYQMADRPTRTELVACANNGVTAVTYTPTGTPFISRDVTMRSLNAQGNSDYKAREGHTFSAIAYAWRIALGRWQARKQPNVAENPVKGQKPVPLTSTPDALTSLLRGVINDLTLGPYPEGCPGPVLDPSPASIEKMNNSVNVLKGTGALLGSVDFIAVEHLIKSETKVNQTNAPY